MKASDNSYPSILVAEQGSTPTSPSAGTQRLFIKTSDHLLYYVNSSGTVTAVGSGTGTTVATDTIWDAAGDLAVGTGADTAAKLTKGAAGGALSIINSAVAWNSGTSFPGSAAAGDRYWRTDRGMEYYYDGTRWLTTTLYFANLAINYTSATVQPMSQASAPYNPHRMVAPTDVYDMWIVNFHTLIRVNTTNSGSHYWTVSLLSVGAAGATLGSANTSADAADTILRKTVAIGALFGTTNTLVQTSIAKTGTPGTVDVHQSAISFRFVG